MAYSVRLNVFPTYDVVNRFLSDILPRLTASDLYVNYDSMSLQGTEDGFATATIEVYDLEKQVFAADKCTISYADMADLATVLERKQVELQLNALLPRMASVGWQIRSLDDDPFHAMLSDTNQKLVLVRSDGTEQEFVPSYDYIRQLRQELARTEATYWVQLHWLELEAAGCEIEFGQDTITVTRGDENLYYGYTLEQAMDLTQTALPKANRLDSNHIV